MFTDSRFDIFGQDFWADEMSIAWGLEAEDVARIAREHPAIQPKFGPWREVAHRWGINWIFVAFEEKINGVLLRPDSGWALIYADPLYRIWIERKPENRPWIVRYEDLERTRQVRSEWERRKG